jgi:transposase
LRPGRRKKLWVRAVKKMDPAVELMEMSLDDPCKRSDPIPRVAPDSWSRALLPSPMQRHMSSFNVSGAVAAEAAHRRPTDGDVAMTTRANDMSRSLAAFNQGTSLVAVVEMAWSSWLVTALIPGVERVPKKKMEPDSEALLRTLKRWRDEATKAGHPITRIAVAYEAGRDGFWLARWLTRHGIEVHVIHSTSVAVSREKRRTKTDRVDAEMLLRVFLGWLRGERGHCSMVAVPTIEVEDARRPGRERETLVAERTRIINRMKAQMARLGVRGFKPHLRSAPKKLASVQTPEDVIIPPNTKAELERDMARLAMLRDQIVAIERERLERIENAPDKRPHAMIRLLARVRGLGIETADMVVNEVITRQLRDRRAVARYAGITGSPDESGSRRREKGLAKAGNSHVRRSMIQLAWRWLMFQKDSDLALWFKARVDAAPRLRKTLIVALARKLLIALWRMATTGEIPGGVVLHPAA